MKLLASAIVLWASLLGSGAKALAGDYIVHYALEVDGKTDAGTMESCEYVRRCQILSSATGVQVTLNFIYPEHRVVHARVQGQPGCCYFADAVDSVSLNPKSSFHHLDIFEGRARRRNEFVDNRRVGVLYLSFSDLRL